MRQAESFKMIKKKNKIKTTLIVLACVVLCAIIYIPLAIAIMFTVFFGVDASVEEHNNVAEYSLYRSGAQAEDEYKNKWGFDESIWPEKVTDKMKVEDYKMVYYNPFDAQYLGYMVVDYTSEDYKEEVARLENYHSTEYKGYFGASGFSDYKLLAMYAQKYNGFVYALTDGKSKIIYVEAIFCNYYMDLDYNKYVPQEYLPDGFDATSDNPYRDEYLKYLGEHQDSPEDFIDYLDEAVTE